MKKVALVLSVFAMAGVPAYLWVAGSALGVSSSHPLGDFAVIDAWLVDKGFEKEVTGIDAKTRRKYGHELDGAQLFVYRCGSEERVDSRVSVVAVGVDDSGRVQAVTGTFWSGVEVTGVASSPGESFMGTLWIDTAGQRPSFADDQRGCGRFAQPVRVATFDRNGVRGQWLKSFASGADARAIRDRVTLSLSAPE